MSAPPSVSSEVSEIGTKVLESVGLNPTPSEPVPTTVPVTTAESSSASVGLNPTPSEPVPSPSETPTVTSEVTNPSSTAVGTSSSTESQPEPEEEEETVEEEEEDEDENERQEIIKLQQNVPTERANLLVHTYNSYPGDWSRLPTSIWEDVEKAQFVRDLRTMLPEEYKKYHIPGEPENQVHVPEKDIPELQTIFRWKLRASQQPVVESTPSKKVTFANPATVSTNPPISTTATTPLIVTGGLPVSSSSRTYASEAELLRSRVPERISSAENPVGYYSGPVIGGPSSTVVVPSTGYTSAPETFELVSSKEGPPFFQSKELQESVRRISKQVDPKQIITYTMNPRTQFIPKYNIPRYFTSTTRTTV